MEIQEVTVTISPAGEVTIAVRGAPGKTCLDVTRDLEALLGGVIEERNWTSEYEDPGEGLGAVESFEDELRTGER